VPVVSPISANTEGVTFNVNADTAAAALAVGAYCSDLVYFSDVPGVLDENNVVLPILSVDAGRALIQAGLISGGMVAKLESIFDAIERGLECVHITQWQGPDTLLHVLADKNITKTTICK
jgi:acetylglutamate kinase